jgi:hypothetical protein
MVADSQRFLTVACLLGRKGDKAEVLPLVEVLVLGEIHIHDLGRQ